MGYLLAIARQGDDVHRAIKDNECFESITFTGHGHTFTGNIYVLGDTSDHNEDFKLFLNLLGLLLCKENSGLELRSCNEATSDPDRQRMIEVAKALGGNVKGWTDFYAVVPHGQEYTAYPDGTIEQTGDTERKFKGGKFDK